MIKKINPITNQIPKAMYDGIESAAGEPGISNKHKNTKDTIDPIIPKFYKLVHTYYSVY